MKRDDIMNQLEKAILIATNAHLGQKDKGGHPYILHPISIMMKMHTEKEKIVAVLHDTIEDTSIDYNLLKDKGFDEEVLQALIAITRVEEESYNDFIRRLYRNKLALRVKIEDLIANSDLSRIPTPTKKDLKRIAKYEKTLERIKSGYYEEKK